MRSLFREHHRVRMIPLLVALFQLALVTGIPVADAVHHSGDHPVTTTGEPSPGGGEGTGLAPVCFICSAGLGVFTTPSGGLTPVVSSDWVIPPDPVPESTPVCPTLTTLKARAPPLA